MKFNNELKMVENSFLINEIALIQKKMLAFLDRPIETRPATVEDIPTVDKDMYALYLIELNQRTGMKKEEIENMLRNDCFLRYKHGEEKYFEINEREENKTGDDK